MKNIRDRLPLGSIVQAVLPFFDFKYVVQWQKIEGGGTLWILMSQYVMMRMSYVIK